MYCTPETTPRLAFARPTQHQLIAIFSTPPPRKLQNVMRKQGKLSRSTRGHFEAFQLQANERIFGCVCEPCVAKQMDFPATCDFFQDKYGSCLSVNENTSHRCWRHDQKRSRKQGSVEDSCEKTLSRSFDGKGAVGPTVLRTLRLGQPDAWFQSGGCWDWGRDWSPSVLLEHTTNN